MANRYWVAGGTGDWNSTTNWSTASGGASGASVPGSSDAAILNASSGSGTVTLDISPDIQTLTCTGFTGTLAFGTNTISLNSTGTIFTGATTMTVTGTPQIICTNSSATARTILPGTGITEANSISFRITAGTGTFTISTTPTVRDLDFTDGVNPTGFAGSLTMAVITIYGSFKASTGMTCPASGNVTTFGATSGTRTIDTAGVTFDRPFTFNGVGGTFQLAAALTSGASRTCTLTNGTLDLNGYTLTTGLFSSTNSNTRTLAFGSTGKIVLIGTSGAIFTTGTFTNLTVTGTSLVQATSGGSGTRTITLGSGAISEANSINFEITSGSDIVSLSGSGGAARSVNFTGFTGTIDIPSSKTIYGSWNSGSATTYSGTSTVTFAATSGSQTIQSGGLTWGSSLVFNGVGGSWTFQDALTSNGSITLTNGTLSTGGYSVSCTTFSSTNSNTRTLNLGASTVSITATGTAWNITDPTNMTLNAGTSTITTSGTSASITFAGGGLTYYNVTFGATYNNTSLSGANTFNNLTVASPAGAGRRTLSISANQTVSGTLTCSGSAPNIRPRITGAAGGNTITAAAVSLAQADFFDITAAGVSSPWSGTNLGDGGGNTNITFAAPKTVYWNQPAGGNWSDVAWALTSGGAVGANNFPLGQDSVILDNTGVGASSTIVMDYGWLIGSLSAGSLTNALTINWNVFGNLTANTLSNVTFSSAITITYTSGAWGIDTLTSTATITTAGVSIPIATVNFNSPSNTMVLGDNFTSTGTSVGLVAGTLDLNGKTLTCVTFDGTFTDLLARTIAFNGGQINVTGNAATVWACEDLTNFSYTGTPTVNFTYSGSTGTRTINNGSTAGGTESNAVSINITAGTDGVTLSTTGTVLNLNYTGFSGAGNLPGSIYGNLTLSATQTITSSTATTTFAATSGTKTITSNGVTIDRPLTFNGVGGTWELQGALVVGSTRALTVTNGAFNANNFNITCGSVALGSGTKTITMGSGTWTIQSSGWDALTNNAGLTLNANTSTISLTSASAKSFAGAGATYYNLNQGGVGALTITGSNTFNAIGNTTQPATVSFTNGTTQTVNNFTLSGTSGNLITINSTAPGSQFNMIKNTGTNVLSSYLSITDSAVTPLGYWFAPTSQGNVNGGNNTGGTLTPRVLPLVTF